MEGKMTVLPQRPHIPILRKIANKTIRVNLLSLKIHTLADVRP